jgi:hypothetical protein
MAPVPNPDRVYTFENLEFNTMPQHQEILYRDASTAGFDHRLTIYTGAIWVGHGTEEHLVDLDFQYPLLGCFDVSGIATAIGILPIGPEFRSAVANASLSNFIVKDTEAFVGVFEVSADLFQIELDASQIINAVVLSGKVTSKWSEVSTVSYHVSVLERLTYNPPPQPPILIAPGGWTGKYNLDASGALGPVLRAGIPQSP